jgi:hypothetical protein
VGTFATALASRGGIVGPCQHGDILIVARATKSSDSMFGDLLSPLEGAWRAWARRRWHGLDLSCQDMEASRMPVRSEA